MMLTKEECENALTNILCNIAVARSDYRTSGKAREDYHTLKSLIEEHFSNPPLYMDEIPKGIWIWDNVNKECIRSLGCVELDGIIYVKFERSENSFITNYLEYEPNRFYRKEVRNVD